MEMHLTIAGGTDLSGQVYRQIALAIRSGRLADGQQLPPSRLLAEQLGISRKPVAEAYARLTYDQLLVGRVGKGSFVCAPSPSVAAGQMANSLGENITLQRWQATATPLRQLGAEGRSRFEFIGGMPAPAHFPQDAWRRCVLHGLRQDARTIGRYGPAQGIPSLREAITRHSGFARGVRCTSAQVLVTNGAQQAFDLLGRVLLAPGDVVAMEDPGYPLARLVFSSQGARIASVGIDDEGIIVDQIPAQAKIIYTTPAHQFPLGMQMSQARREALLYRAREIGALIIEDDYDSEFRYEGRPTDSLQSMDRVGVVAFVGSFSKIMLPEIRLGYLVAPPALMNPLLAAKHVSDWHTATTMQHALARFMEDGLLLKHIRRGHSIYASRRDELMKAFSESLTGWFDLVPNTAGFHIAAKSNRPLDIALLQRLARRADVGLYALGDFYAERPAVPGLLMGYGAIETLDIGPALQRVHDILLQMD
jgi:GntR family transcriptional regulator / MocR family aminotransferase